MENRKNNDLRLHNLFIYCEIKSFFVTQNNLTVKTLREITLHQVSVRTKKSFKCLPLHLQARRRWDRHTEESHCSAE